MRTVVKRMQRPTPKFFKRLRNIGAAIAAVGTVLVSAPVTLPAIVVTIGGYLIVGGTVAMTVSQAAVKHEKE